jgi:hypothetical protein
LQSQSAVTLDPRKLQAACKLSPKKFIENNAELEKRLEKLANATSAETILTDSKNLNKISINVKGKFFLYIKYLQLQRSVISRFGIFTS